MQIVHRLEKLRKRLVYKPGPAYSSAELRSAAEMQILIVRFFYCVLCFIFYSRLNSLVEMSVAPPAEPLWPMQLMWSSIIEDRGILLATVLPISALLAVVFPGALVWRLVSFIGILMVSSYVNSFGSINHGLHFVLFIAFGFLFLPNGRLGATNLTRRQVLNTLYVFWGIQLLLLSLYSLSGLWKILGFGAELFDHNTLTLKVLDRSIENDGDHVLWQGFAASYPTTTQALHLLTVFVQVTSVIVFFQPHFYRAYGFLLIFFHFGTTYLLGITFSFHVFAWSMFFILNPMAPKHGNFVLVLHSIPIFGWLFRRLFPLDSQGGFASDKGYAVIIYDNECPFCSQYVAYMHLKSAVRELRLINAREEDDPLIDEAKRRGYRLDDGMIFVLDGEFYYGSDAMHKITRLSEIDGIATTSNHLLFSNRTAAKLLYPVLKEGRRLTLKAMGRKPLGY